MGQMITRKADEEAIAYADEQLKLYRPDIASMEIARSRKMAINVFNGTDVERAYALGYEVGAKFVFDKIWDYISELPCKSKEEADNQKMLLSRIQKLKNG